MGGSERADNGGIASIQEAGSHEDQNIPIFVQLDRLGTISRSIQVCCWEKESPVVHFLLNSITISAILVLEQLPAPRHKILVMRENT
jgi:hypothetical protein